MRSWHKRLAVASLGTLLALPLTGCGGGSSGAGPAGDKPFVVYFTGDYSSEVSTNNASLDAGIKLAAEEFNASGGIDGRRIVVETANDQNDPTKAVSLLQQRLASGDKPDLVYPGGSSAVSLSLLPILTRQKIISVGGTVSTLLNDPAKFPYHFGISSPGQDYVPALLNEAKAKGYKKIAMLYSNDATGQSSAKIYKEAVEGAGLRFTEARYEASALDMTSQLNQLRAQDPDALVLNGYGTAALYVMRSRAQIGWDVPSYCDQLCSSFPYLKNLDAGQLKNVYVAVSSASLSTSERHPGLAGFIGKIKAGPAGEGITSTGWTLYSTGHDALALVVYAARQANSTDADRLKATLEKLPQPSGPPPWFSAGPKGEYLQFAYTPTDHFPAANAETYQYVSPGTYNEDGFYVPGQV
ncbi:branched-chain amino acid transport system substrate-binding protein [Thermocatellispora tengchongensis]|uniref:Branched-chain amino acid transport system substrate-binding protein n=1 Tax=Thermocatellispora tengchongensis TaxID=1073253 RepID=A0A840PLF4_9ACTN|nr:ABC transporter substrate-binding protein [Thermocatellispora tengchongensis]MBB5139779.1 branched-chain amino acid transport system substrate-binding protein [Thermocatellispora tengchongensis]